MYSADDKGRRLREGNMQVVLWINVVIFTGLGILWKSDGLINVLAKLTLIVLSLANFYWIFEL